MEAMLYILLLMGNIKKAYQEAQVLELVLLRSQISLFPVTKQFRLTR